jgi:hypothetical protein
MAFNHAHGRILPAAPEIDRRQMVHDAVEQLWGVYVKPPEPTQDIDLVWAVSAPGTVKTAAHFEDDPGNPYNNTSFNVGIVDHAVDLVRQVTALRKGKPVDEITKEDIRSHGPKLLYNGESLSSSGTRFPQQNEDFRELCRKDDFPLPLENIIVGEIETANTPGQVKQLAELLSDSGLPAPRKVAVVCGTPHMTRTGRYLQRSNGLFPSGTEFVPAVLGQGTDEKMSRLAALEVKKALTYAAMGHLDPHSIFFDDEVPMSPRHRGTIAQVVVERRARQNP